VARIPKKVLDLYDDMDSVKMLATVDKQWNVNVVPVSSAGVLDEEALAFADVLLGKTRENLATTKRATVTVFKPPMAGYQAKGIFLGWQTSGPVYEKYIAKAKERIEKTGISSEVKGIGTLQINEVYSINPLLTGKRIV
jgi:predicted pyridoxine 5'-phosphate oxidase superfamily flavin-nucleotide-binding protein